MSLCLCLSASLVPFGISHSFYSLGVFLSLCVSGTPEFPSVLHKDSYLLFRALCRLSIKGQSEEGTPAQGHNVPISPAASRHT
jgi:hypothetical protein